MICRTNLRHTLDVITEIYPQQFPSNLISFHTHKDCLSQELTVKAVLQDVFISYYTEEKLKCDLNFFFILVLRIFTISHSLELHWSLQIQICWSNGEFIRVLGNLKSLILSVRNNSVVQWFTLPYSQYAEFQATRVPTSVLEDMMFSMPCASYPSQPPVHWYILGTGPISILNPQQLVFTSSRLSPTSDFKSHTGSQYRSSSPALAKGAILFSGVLCQDQAKYQLPCIWQELN